MQFPGDRRRCPGDHNDDGLTSGYATVHAARLHPSSEDEVPTSVAMTAATFAGLGCRNVLELGHDAPESIAMMATTIADVALQAAVDALLNPIVCR